MVFSSGIQNYYISISVQFSGYEGESKLIVFFKGNSYNIFPPEVFHSPFIADSLSIQGRSFRNVKAFANDADPASAQKFCFYNADSGIIKMDLYNGDSWELLKIE